jgi:undecaprenyl-diphosphatase
MDIPYFSTQLQWLESIATHRSVFLNPIFLFLNYFDTVYFLMIVIPVVWIAVSPRWGLRIALVLILSALINFHLKWLFHSPRPIEADPTLAMLPFRDPGFPSGAAQTSALLAGLLVYGWKSAWAWAIAIPYALLIGFSRLYLGVHYPTDVLGGYCIGLALLFAFIYSIDPIEKFCKEQKGSFCVIIAAILSLLYVFLAPSPQGYRLIASFLGFCLGAYGAHLFRLNPAKRLPLRIRISSASLTVLTVYILYFLTRNILSPIQSFLISFWISFAAFPFCRAFLSTGEAKR